MSARSRLAALLLLASLTGGAVAAGLAVTPLVAGTSVSSKLELGGKRVALPGGDWVVGADIADDWSNPGVGAFGYVRHIVLLHVDANRVDAVLEINTNALQTADGWGIAADCGRQDLLLAVVHYRAGWDGSCYFVTHTQLEGDANAAWRGASALAQAKGWALPRVAVTAGFRIANRSDVLDLRYHFAPPSGIADAAAGKWADSPWAISRIDADPSRMAFARAVSDWAVGYISTAEAGLQNGPGQTDVAPLPVVATDAGTDAASKGRSELALLHQSGRITDAEYAEKLKLLTTGETPKTGDAGSGVAMDLSAITFVKGLSYRIIVSISHIFVDYYWTNNYVAAGALEILQITINSTKFYFHELAWAKYMGVPRTDAARIIDFTYIGKNA